MCLGILKITFIIIKKKQATVKIKQELELSEFSLLHLFIYLFFTTSAFTSPKTCNNFFFLNTASAFYPLSSLNVSSNAY